LRLLTAVKPLALRGRYDFFIVSQKSSFGNNHSWILNNILLRCSLLCQFVFIVPVAFAVNCMQMNHTTFYREQQQPLLKFLSVTKFPALSQMMNKLSGYAVSAPRIRFDLS